jgi:conjugal transfer ATP-binding protein TraC
MSAKPRFYDSLLSGLFGDSKRPEAERPDLAVPMLAHWLPYRSYDPKTGIFYNSASRGFVIEVSPLVGADERTGEILTQFLSEGIPVPGCLQFHDWMSPRISERLSKWYLPRYSASGVYERMAKHRVDFLTDGVWNSLSADAPFCLRNHRVAISYSTPESSRVSTEEIVAVMDGLISVLGSIGVSARKMDPVALIGWIDDITSPTTAAGDDVISYNPLDPIADQAVRRDIEMKVDPDRILLRTERFRPTGKEVNGAPEIGEIYPDVFDVRSFSVRNLPQRWAPWDCARLIGDMFADKLRMPCPVSTNLCLDFPDPQASSNKAGFKFMRTTSLADSKSARFLPQLRDQSQEWKFVNDEIRQGRKLVRLFYSVTSFSPREGRRQRARPQVGLPGRRLGPARRPLPPGDGPLVRDAHDDGERAVPRPRAHEAHADHAQHDRGEPGSHTGRVSRWSHAAPAPDRPTGPALLLEPVRERRRQP